VALFEIYCISCHGAAGDGMGVLVMREKFLGVPSYKDRVITEGSIFHIVTLSIQWVLTLIKWMLMSDG
jgi:uncharacterized membrane protein (DUF485 family)